MQIKLTVVVRFPLVSGWEGCAAAAAAAGPPLADFNGSRFDGPGKLGILYGNEREEAEAAAEAEAGNAKGALRSD